MGPILQTQTTTASLFRMRKQPVHCACISVINEQTQPKLFKVTFFNFKCFIPVDRKIIKNKIFLIKVKPTPLINNGLVRRRVREYGIC